VKEVFVAARRNRGEKRYNSVRFARVENPKRLETDLDCIYLKTEIVC